MFSFYVKIFDIHKIFTADEILTLSVFADCTCKNGECDNWVNGTGQCKPYTCKNGYYGQDCEKCM